MFKGRLAGAVLGRVGLLLALSCPASHAATGKIAGVVRDAGSGAPLPAANVVLVGTRWGAAADGGGRFFILNIPPGTYTLKITYVGYVPCALEDVRVSADLTTRLEVVLEAAGVQVEEVVVRAERPLIDKNATNAVRILEGADLEVLPLRGVHNALGLQTGMVEEQGRFHVRGSRSDEIGYYVEGANVRNIVTGFSAVELIDEALAEVQLQAGGFNAEYGGANGGIVLQELRTGGPRWDVGFLAESDRFTGKYRERLGTFSYGYSNQVLTLSGPLAGQRRVRLFAAGQRRARDSRPVFWDGFEFAGLADSGDRGGSLHWGAAGLPDSVRVLRVRPGNIDHSGRQALIFNGTLLFDYHPFQVRCTGLYSEEELKLNPAPVRNILNRERLPRTTSVSALLRARATHLLDPSLFYQLSLTRYNQGRKSADPIFEDHFWVYNDSAAVASGDKGFVPYFRQGVAPRPYDLHGFPFNRFGSPTSFANGISDASFFFEEADQYWGLAGSLVKQTRVHQLKLGFDYQRWTSRRYLVLLRSLRAAIAADHPHLEAVYRRYYGGEIGAGEILDEMIAAASAAPPGEGDLDDFRKLVRRNSQADFYGFDEFGRRRDGSGLEAPRRPVVAAAYFQDKVEYNDLIVNAGLRYDYFDVDSWRFKDPAAPVRDAEAVTIDLASMRRTRRFHRLSPRLGLSFPVSDRTAFHVQYGRFVQMPRLRDMFTGAAALSLELSGSHFIPSPTAFDVEPVRTTQYEIGFEHQLGGSAAFDLTGFYRDVRGQLQVRRQDISLAAVDAGAYNFLQNGDFATVRGLEMVFRLRRTLGLRAVLNYTLSAARGTGSAHNSAIAAVENEAVLPTVVAPLDFNETHRGNVHLDYRVGHDSGLAPLRRMGANLLVQFSSGHNFTLVGGSIGQRGPELGAILAADDPRQRRPLEAINSSTTPWRLQVDLGVDKGFTLFTAGAQVFVYVQNLFNRRNVVNVYGRTGNAGDDGFLSDKDLSSQVVEAHGGQVYRDLYEAINLANRQHYWFTSGGDLYDEPRRIRFGVKVGL